MSCIQTISDYALRSIGIGERRLPVTDITLCDQFVLIGSGLLWNLYFAVFAIGIGFFLATAIALGRTSSNSVTRIFCEQFVFVFRGSPLFIQLFFAYELFVLLPRLGFELNFGFMEITVETRWLAKAWLGALIVLILNTAAYSAEIFYHAYRAIPVGDLEAAKAYGMSGFTRFRRIVWPNMLRIAWPAYTNEAIFLFHTTTLAYISAFPAWRQQGDALYYAKYIADKTFNPFIPYPITGMYFIIATLLIIFVFSFANRRLNRHLSPGKRSRFRYRPQLIR